MSTAPSAEKRLGSRGSDIGGAFGLFLLEAAALIVIMVHYWVSGWSFDPATPAAYGPVWGHLAAIAVVGAVTWWAGTPVFRRHAKVTAWSQRLMAGLIAGLVMLGAVGQLHEDFGNRPAPGFTGEVGCRSGGGNDECADTGR